MINKIKDLLEKSEADGYKIVEVRTSSEELFYVKKDLDTERTKDVQHFKVTVYKDFEEEGVKYTGSSSFDVHPTMKEEELKKIVDDGIYAAGLVKNEYYELPKKSEDNVKEVTSKFSSMELSKWMPKLAEALYLNDTEEKGGINSAEIFLDKNYKRIVMSNGTDVNWESYSGMIEFITTWKETEEIELYKMLTFSDYDPEYISESVREMILLAKERAKASKTVASGKYKIILKGEPVKEVLSYYAYVSSADAVYNKISNYKIDSSIQGNNVEGDKINLVLDPYLKNSVHSSPFDNDGIALKKVSVIEEGKLKIYHGDFKNSYYLKNKTTGNIGNFIVSEGSRAISDMEKEPYLELVTFSDFQIDPVTGNFGGEIRLGWYFDGKTTIPVTGGSLSGNIKDIHSNMYLSKELQSQDGFVGPEAIEMFDMTIAGK
ncbi:MAG: TldD/PmbA family protein [Clostridium sp.]|nr:TldD/PmbA family protein [Clostridium sp.]